MRNKPKNQRKPGRPAGSSKYDRQISVLLPRTLLDVIEERMAKQKITFSEALRRCLTEYHDSTHATEQDRVVVAISAQDRDDIRRLVSNHIVPVRSSRLRTPSTHTSRVS